MTEYKGDIKIDVTNITDCWNWSGSCSHFGYGVLSFYKRNYFIHRLSYRVFVGKIPNNKVIMHKCDNPKCFNPYHLELGTQRQNVDDMWRKGRARVNGRFFKDNNPKLKFSKETVEKMINDYKEGISIKIIRQTYGISAPHFFRLRRRYNV